MQLLETLINVWIGAFMLLAGTVTLVMRFVAPESPLFRKQEAMRERFGHQGGTAAHVVAYTVMPLIGGAILVGTELLAP